MYQFIKNLVLRVLKVPPEPLDPMGEVGSLKVFRASPNFFKYRLYVWIIGNIFSAFLLAFGAGISVVHMLKTHVSTVGFILVILSLAAICIVGLVHLVISFIMLRLDYEMRWYKITDRSLRIREGVVFVREMTMTFANIQNISISQGPIQRFFGIADLKVETAGGGGVIQPDQGSQNPVFSMHIGFFRGVDNHEEIRDMMLARLKKLRDSGLGDTDERHHVAAPSTAQVPHDSSLIDILKAVHTEASLLRKSAEGLRG